MICQKTSKSRARVRGKDYYKLKYIPSIRADNENYVVLVSKCHDVLYIFWYMKRAVGHSGMKYFRRIPALLVTTSY